MAFLNSTTAKTVHIIDKVVFKERDLKELTSPGGLEPPTFRLTAERANRLRHGDNPVKVQKVLDLNNDNNKQLSKT